jgi:hypothetical protein
MGVSRINLHRNKYNSINNLQIQPERTHRRILRYIFAHILRFSWCNYRCFPKLNPFFPGFFPSVDSSVTAALIRQNLPPAYSPKFSLMNSSSKTEEAGLPRAIR